MRFTALSASLVLAGGLAACSPGSAQSQPTVTETVTASEGSTTSPAPSHHGYEPFIDTAGIVKVATQVQEAAGGRVIAVDTDNRDREVKVKVLVGGEKVTFKVPEGGEARETEREKTSTAYPDDLIDLPAALKAAGVKDGDFLDEAEIDEDDGRFVWEISVDDAHGSDLRSIDVDAHSGDVVKEKQKQ